MDRDLSDELRYPPFEQPGPDIQNQEVIYQTRVRVFHAAYKHRGLVYAVGKNKVACDYLMCSESS